MIGCLELLALLPANKKYEIIRGHLCNSRLSPDSDWIFEPANKKSKIMKTLIIFLVSLSAGTVHAQEISHAEVPSVVSNALKAKFPKATDLEWELRGDVYKADFEIGSIEHDVWIDKSGKINEHKEDIKTSELPQSIAENLTREFASYQVDDVCRIEKNGTVAYEIDLDGKGDDRTVTYSSEGIVVANSVD
jgi:uncharacterized membrane protein YkoI